MSRSGYTDDCDDMWAHIRWRGAVNSAIKGKRGQAFLKEVLTALEALPEKRLTSESLMNAEGQYCTLGAVGRLRGMDMPAIEDEDDDWQEYIDAEDVAGMFGISRALAAEIMFENDEWIGEYEYKQVEICGPMLRPWEGHRRSVRVPVKDAGKRRWEYMYKWVKGNIV